jgi:sensor histidine kinase regulating citrate/malate metabolism
MNTKEIAQVMENNQTMFADGLEEAIIGIDTSGDISRVVYDIDKIIDILKQTSFTNVPEDVQMPLTELEAIEYFNYNILGAYVGEGTPMYIYTGNHQRVLELMSNL